jgi:hypothetical protein
MDRRRLLEEMLDGKPSGPSPIEAKKVEEHFRTLLTAVSKDAQPAVTDRCGQ